MQIDKRQQIPQVSCLIKPLETNWIVITGAPSSGKTTLIHRLEKLGYKICNDIAREVIKEHLANSDKNDEFFKQTKIVERFLLKQSDFFPDELVIFDYGMPDNIVFQAKHGFKIELAERAARLIRYRAVILLMPLEIENDGIRKLDKHEQHELFHSIFNKYKEYGYSPIIIQPEPIEARIKKVLNLIQEEL